MHFKIYQNIPGLVKISEVFRIKDFFYLIKKNKKTKKTRHQRSIKINISTLFPTQESLCSYSLVLFYILLQYGTGHCFVIYFIKYLFYYYHKFEKKKTPRCP